MKIDTTREVIEVDFRPTGDKKGLDDLALRVKKRILSKCRHSKSTVDEALRTVTCRDCGAILDAVEVLIGIANDAEKRTANAIHLRHETERLTKAVEELTRQRKNLKAQIRRAKK